MKEVGQAQTVHLMMASVLELGRSKRRKKRSYLREEEIQNTDDSLTGYSELPFQSSRFSFRVIIEGGPL